MNFQTVYLVLGWIAMATAGEFDRYHTVSTGQNPCEGFSLSFSQCIDKTAIVKLFQAQGTGCNIYSQLLQVTLPVICTNATASYISTALLFKHKDATYLITNRHALCDNFTKVSVLWIDGVDRVVDTDTIFFHPNSAIDLAGFPVDGDFQHLRFLDRSFIPTKGELFSIEKVVLIGYPLGWWDQVNQKPVVRSGITLNDPNDDFGGDPKGHVDMTVVPGSSGSPILIADMDRLDPTNCVLSVGTPFVRLLGIAERVSTFDSHRGIYIKAKEIPVMIDHSKK